MLNACNNIVAWQIFILLVIWHFTIKGYGIYTCMHVDTCTHKHHKHAPDTYTLMQHIHCIATHMQHTAHTCIHACMHTHMHTHTTFMHTYIVAHTNIHDMLIKGAIYFLLSLLIQLV